ncbi:MAG TPA: DUF2752 domain-containing protein, partial [Isosphaeraceae bacterium]
MDLPQSQDRSPGITAGGGIGRRAGEDSPRLGAIARAGLLALAAVLIGLFATAGRLSPDPRGYGTHEQLGLSPCAILRLTGRPCPTCGMTTSFAWLARGDPARAWRANPAGLLAAVVGAGLVPWLLLVASTGRAPGRRPVGA